LRKFEVDSVNEIERGSSFHILMAVQAKLWSAASHFTMMYHDLTTMTHISAELWHNVDNNAEIAGKRSVEYP